MFNVILTFAARGFANEGSRNQGLACREIRLAKPQAAIQRKQLHLLGLGAFRDTGLQPVQDSLKNEGPLSNHRGPHGLKTRVTIGVLKSRDAPRNTQLDVQTSLNRTSAPFITRTPACRISSMARSTSPGRTFTPRQASSIKTVSNPSDLASRAVNFTQ